ncbi:alpha/beta hydrolase-fold protein [Candidatus Latescibacterota bacterium]
MIKKHVLCFVLLMAIMAGGTCLAQNFQAHPSPYNFPGVEYPRIESDSRVTFSFNAPDAAKVQVAIANVPLDMVKDADGVWTITTEPQDPGYHNYWMLVDGALVLDPRTDAFIGYGHMCNGFEIPAADQDFYTPKDVPHGNVLVDHYFAKASDSWRRIFVYTPPDYETNSSARYPVLYLQHGGGEDERVWIEMGRTNVILDNLIAEGKANSMIIVMESSAVGPPPVRRNADGSRRRFTFDAFERLLIDELIPYIDANYRTLSDQPHRAMSGLSMGGMQTKQITLANLNVFSHIGIFSGGSIVPSDITDMDVFKQKVKLVFTSYGSLERGAATGLESSESLKQAGINSTYYESPQSAHEWQAWRRSIYQFAPLLFRD